MNNWYSNKTHGKIDKIIEELNPNTLMIILNSVYFKGEWFSKFSEDLTIKLPFNNLGSENINLNIMDQIEYFNYYEDKKVQDIELYFIDDYMCTHIILPFEGTDINRYIIVNMELIASILFLMGSYFENGFLTFKKYI